MNKKKQIGLVVGGGAGPELADVFRETLDRLSIGAQARFEIVECSHRPKSFTEMKHVSKDDFEASVLQDIELLSVFYHRLGEHQDRAIIFRTAVNAEALYVMRRKMCAIKVIETRFDSWRLLLIRDASQGFYANNEWRIGTDLIEFTGSYTFELLRRIYEESRNEADRRLNRPYKTWLVYKHHLFANVFCRWAEKLGNIDEVLQPGMAYSAFLKQSVRSDSDVLLIAGNEIADLLHEMLLGRNGPYARETEFAQNLYLLPCLRGLLEYQTVHGSADDLAGTGRVNPLATIRATAAIVENESEECRAIHAVEAAISEAVETGRLSRSLELQSTTKELVGFVLEQAERSWR